MKERSGVLGGGLLFKRMSFNPKLWEVKRKDMESVANSVTESIDESQNTSKKAYEFGFDHIVRIILLCS